MNKKSQNTKNKYADRARAPVYFRARSQTSKVGMKRVAQRESPALYFGKSYPIIHTMINRWITHKLNEAIQHSPAVALLGARQVGKTTLARQISKHRACLYLDLESPDDRIKLDHPTTYLSAHNHQLVILDEIQRAPELFSVLRGLIDQNRATGHTAGHFLCLGSASMAILKQTAESLAGRISYIEMSGLHSLEIPQHASNRQTLWFRGGFPESYLSKTDAQSSFWLENLIRTYLERDIPQMGFHIPATRLRRMWTMLAHLQGETVNASKLASNLEVNNKTIGHYIDVLVDLFLVRRLEPWYNNTKKRLVKSPRFYIRDTGILHQLLGIAHHEALLSHPVLGKSWEGFVIENILSILPHAVQAYFYRTASGCEIDLLLQCTSTQRIAIEIKYGLTPKLRQGFHQACRDVNATHKYVVYSGDDTFSLGHDTTCIGLHQLMQRLAQPAP